MDGTVVHPWLSQITMQCCCVFPWHETRALPLPGLSLQPDHRPPPLLSAAGARTQGMEGRFCLQDQIEDTGVLETGQGPGLDDPSAKVIKAEVSL